MYYNFYFILRIFFYLHLKNYCKKCNPKLVSGLKYNFIFQKTYLTWEKNLIQFLIASWVLVMRMCSFYLFSFYPIEML